MRANDYTRTVVYRLPEPAGKRTGCVYLVGAGPGDPDLLTVKAQRLLQCAEVVVYDRLVGDEVLDLVVPSAERVYVGKADGQHHLPQAGINQLLVDLARTGRDVVRLKGGDPLVFGRGGEEALFLAEHGVPFVVVPGITAANACAGYAGIPLTHRGLANSVQFITGHACGDEPLQLDWASYAQPDTTLVVYMGLKHLSQIAAGLITAGRDAETPAAIIEDGTLPTQRCYRAPLSRIAEQARQAGVRSPALVIIGDVVSLATVLDWFSSSTAATSPVAASVNS